MGSGRNKQDTQDKALPSSNDPLLDPPRIANAALRRLSPPVEEEATTFLGGWQ